MSNSPTPSDDDAPEVETVDPAEGDSVDEQVVEADRFDGVGSEGEAVEGEVASAEERPRGFFSDLEDGFAHLMAAFEQGVINIADGEGKKRAAANKAAGAAKGGADVRAPEAIDGESSDAEITDAETKDTAVAVATNDAAARTEAADGGGDQAEGAADSAGDTDNEPVEPWPGMTWEEALPPIRWGRIVLGLLAVLVLGGLYWGATYLQVRAAAGDDDTRRADVAVVLGAAQFDGTPSPVLATRLDHALELWRDNKVEFIATTGANQEGDRFTEGFSGFVYLREAGVPEETILTIVDGVDTYQQLSASLIQMQERELDTALLVSDSYHNQRLRSIADELGMEAYVSPTSIEPTEADYLRESVAVGLGRLASYRRLSAWMSATEDDE